MVKYLEYAYGKWRYTCISLARFCQRLTKN